MAEVQVSLILEEDGSWARALTLDWMDTLTSSTCLVLRRLSPSIRDFCLRPGRTTSAGVVPQSKNPRLMAGLAVLKLVLTFLQKWSTCYLFSKQHPCPESKLNFFVCFVLFNLESKIATLGRDFGIVICIVIWARPVTCFPPS